MIRVKGIVMYSNVEPGNGSPIWWRPSHSWISVNEMHSLNAPPSLIFIVEGMQIQSYDLQPKNAPFPMDSSPSLSSNSHSDVQFWKAPLPIFWRLAGSRTFSNFSLFETASFVNNVMELSMVRCKLSLLYRRVAWCGDGASCMRRAAVWIISIFWMSSSRSGSSRWLDEDEDGDCPLYQGIVGLAECWRMSIERYIIH